MMMKTTTKSRVHRRGRRRKSDGMGGYAVVFMSEVYRAERRTAVFRHMMDVDVPWGPGCRAVPMGKGTPRAGKERLVGKKRYGIGPFYRFCLLGVILGQETQSRFGRRFGGEMHRVVGGGDNLSVLGN
jgi:hypothetical protein